MGYERGEIGIEITISKPVESPTLESYYAEIRIVGANEPSN